MASILTSGPGTPFSPCFPDFTRPTSRPPRPRWRRPTTTCRRRHRRRLRARSRTRPRRRCHRPESTRGSGSRTTTSLSTCGRSSGITSLSKSQTHFRKLGSPGSSPVGTHVDPIAAFVVHKMLLVFETKLSASTHLKKICPAQNLIEHVLKKFERSPESWQKHVEAERVAWVGPRLQNRRLQTHLFCNRCFASFHRFIEKR